MRARLSPAAVRAFRSLRVPNFRLYFLGQIVSLSGTWMQTVAEIWLVLRLTHSGVALGVTAALQFVPILLAGAWGGVLVDRFDKRRLIMVTQTAMAVPALALWALTTAGVAELWMVWALVFARGCVNAIDNPARRTFIHDMVGPAHLVSAVSLNSALVNSARIFGPAIAGVLIATVGVSPCFAINALSFGAVIFALARMDPGALQRDERLERTRGQVRSAVAHVWRTPALRLPLALTLVAGTLAFNFRVTLPLLATDGFHGGGALYGALTAAMGVGAILGALGTASRARPTAALLTGSTVAFGVLILAVAAAPTLVIEIVALIAMGMASIAFTSTANASLQLAVSPAMRGRVMALYSVVFLGSTPIGSPLIGWVAGTAGPRIALAVGGAATAAAGLAAIRSLSKHSTKPAHQSATALRPASKEAHGSTGLEAPPTPAAAVQAPAHLDAPPAPAPAAHGPAHLEASPEPSPVPAARGAAERPARTHSDGSRARPAASPRPDGHGSRRRRSATNAQP